MQTTLRDSGASICSEDSRLSGVAGNMCPFFIHHTVGPNIFLLDFSSNYLKNLLAFDNELQCYNALPVGAVVQLIDLMCETFLKFI